MVLRLTNFLGACEASLRDSDRIPGRRKLKHWLISRGGTEEDSQGHRVVKSGKSFRGAAAAALGSLGRRVERYDAWTRAGRKVHAGTTE